MRVMVMVKATTDSEAGVMPSTELLAAMGKYNEELVNAGILLAGEGLHPSSQGKRVAFDGPSRTVIDGPFAETKELVAGFWLWQVKDMAEAIEWVKRCPNPMPGPSEIEVRQVFEAADFGEVTHARTRRTGRSDPRKSSEALICLLAAVPLVSDAARFELAGVAAAEERPLGRRRRLPAAVGHRQLSVDQHMRDARQVAVCDRVGERRSCRPGDGSADHDVGWPPTSRIPTSTPCARAVLPVATATAWPGVRLHIEAKYRTLRSMPRGMTPVPPGVSVPSVSR